MATIKKACKGVSYPKSSNVSGRLGSISKAKTGKLVPSTSSVSKRLGTIKKAQKGTSLGMKSVKAGIDKNPGVTRADIIVAAKKQAKKGIKIKKAQNGDNSNIPPFADKINLTKKQSENLKNEMNRRKQSLDSSRKDFQKKLMKAKSTVSGKKGMKMGGKMKKCAYGCK